MYAYSFYFIKNENLKNLTCPLWHCQLCNLDMPFQTFCMSDTCMDTCEGLLT
uniref:Uncharacterized protein n=1 Tax=Anguilla anguilla TaxID=7936 RepID=A0A0E9RWL3_ANGAN